mmetsp:Transcript_134195/g.233164  ORF Transcript_134195/g.233164 Transcript_134195/m.233164 type:complete len:142 (+) Transcript_134195:114-539(+)
MMSTTGLTSGARMDKAPGEEDTPVANMRVKVHVREKTFVVSCGDGGQRIRWLANVGIVRYDEKTKGMELGPPRGVRMEDGARLNLDDIICTRLTDGADVWVILKEDLIYTETDANQTAVGYSVPDRASPLRAHMQTPAPGR